MKFKNILEALSLSQIRTSMKNMEDEKKKGSQNDLNNRKLQLNLELAKTKNGYQIYGKFVKVDKDTAKNVPENSKIGPFSSAGEFVKGVNDFLKSKDFRLINIPEAVASLRKILNDISYNKSFRKKSGKKDVGIVYPSSKSPQGEWDAFSTIDGMGKMLNLTITPNTKFENEKKGILKRPWWAQ